MSKSKFRWILNTFLRAIAGKVGVRLLILSMVNPATQVEIIPYFVQVALVAATNPGQEAVVVTS
jgi:hypothetical protein